MNKITMREWIEMIGEVVDATQKRWPLLSMEFSGAGVRIGDTRIAARVELRYGDGDLRPAMDVSTGAALVGSVTSVEAGLRSYREVLDATYAIMAAVESVSVELPGAEGI